MYNIYEGENADLMTKQQKLLLENQAQAEEIRILKRKIVKLNSL